MLLYLVGYLCVGMLGLLSVSIFHVSTAIRKGYDIKVMREVLRGVNKESVGLIRFVFGWFIWPIRIVQFINDMNLLYEAYDQFENES